MASVQYRTSIAYVSHRCVIHVPREWSGSNAGIPSQKFGVGRLASRHFPTYSPMAIARVIIEDVSLFARSDALFRQPALSVVAPNVRPSAPAAAEACFISPAWREIQT